MNAFKLTKLELFEVGKDLTETFLQHNGLPVPHYRAGSLHSPNPPRGTYGCGYYSHRPDASGTICVDPAACAAPARGIGRQRSFPTYSTDRTPVGVVAHEAGHAIERFTDLSDFDAWHDLLRPRDRISSYEPNFHEAFAESMRIFILNPALLKLLSPRRWHFINTHLSPTNIATDPLATLLKWKVPKPYIETINRRMGTYDEFE